MAISKENYFLHHRKNYHSVTKVRFALSSPIGNMGEDQSPVLASER